VLRVELNPDPDSSAHTWAPSLAARVDQRSTRANGA
jgi:hypothetical protein